MKSTSARHRDLRRLVALQPHRYEKSLLPAAACPERIRPGERDDLERGPPTCVGTKRLRSPCRSGRRFRFPPRDFGFPEPIALGLVLVFDVVLSPVGGVCGPRRVPLVVLPASGGDDDDERERSEAITKAECAKGSEQCIVMRMKVGIVVPYSWSFWGAVVEHAELQAAALGGWASTSGSSSATTRPGASPVSSTPARTSRRAAAGGHPDRPLGDRAGERVAAEHHPQPALGLADPAGAGAGALRPRPHPRADDSDARLATMALARCPIVATFHASGELSWLKLGKPVWGFLLDRIDHRIAVSEPARETAARYFPGDYELIPNGVLVPERPSARPRGANRLRRAAGAAQGPPGPAPRLARDAPRARARGCASSAPIRLPCGSSSRASACPTRASTCSASSRRTS